MHFCRTNRRRLVAGVVGLIVILSVLAVKLPLGHQSYSGRFEARPVPGYVGSQSCTGCHPQIFEQFARSGMARSWKEISARPSLQSPPSSIQHRASDFSYRLLLTSDRLDVQESRPAAVGAAVGASPHELTKQVQFTVGSGNRAQAYVISSGGYLTLAPINWYKSSVSWDLNPGYESRNLRFDRPVLGGCVACHNGQGRLIAGSVNRYELPIPNGIGCEQCHGPGARHVAEHGRSGKAYSQTAAGDSTIINPARLDPNRQNDVCFQCHLAPDVRWWRWNRPKEQFLPGARLADYRADFFAQPEDPNAVGVASHGARMVQSRCSIASGGRLTCVVCHDVHLPAAETTRATYDSRCLNCHASQDCATGLQSTPSNRSCTVCHMPAGPVSNAPHVVFTDHWIRANPEPVPALQEGRTKSRRVSGKPARLDAFGSEAVSDAEQAVAYIAYFDEHTEDRFVEDLRYGLSHLEKAWRSNSSGPAEVEYWLGVGYGHLSQWPKAIRFLEACIRHTLRDPEQLADAYWRLGQAHQEVGQLQEAIRIYERLHKEFPDDLKAVQSLVPLKVGQGRLDEAIELCRESLGRNRNQPALLANLSFARLRQAGSAAESRSLLDEAQRLDPDLPLVYFTRASMLESVGDHASAKTAYRDGFCALARGSLASGDWKQAAEYLDRAIEADPSDTAVRQWRKQVTTSRECSETSP